MNDCTTTRLVYVEDGVNSMRVTLREPYTLPEIRDLFASHGRRRGDFSRNPVCSLAGGIARVTFEQPDDRAQLAALGVILPKLSC